MEVRRRATLAVSRAILLFDQDAQLRDRLRHALEAEGHRVEAVGDEKAAVRALRARTYDLIIADLFSSGGRRVRQQLRLYPQRAPVLAITRGVPLQALVQAMTDVAWDFLRVGDPVRDWIGVVRRTFAYFDIEREWRALEIAGGALNAARYERMRRRVDAALADVATVKRELDRRAPRRGLRKQKVSA